MIPNGDLESYLKTYGGNYFGIYEDVKKCASRIWKHPRLKWYTDHGVAHSERIVFHLNGLCDGFVIDPKTKIPDYGLNYGEVFYLLCAAWLHDIGMQDLTDLNDLSVDQMTEDAWTQVRERHPARSFEIIMEHAAGTDETNEFWLGLRRSPLVHYPLALICKGHGSTFFDEAVAEISQLSEDLDGKGTKIRGELLMSLLLMADEADLHQARADFGENYPLSNISKLHHFRHHYTQQVKIVSGHGESMETAKTVTLQFAFPVPGEQWAQDVKQWIADKLKKETERTFPHLHRGFNGHFLWSEKPVAITVRKAGPYEKKEMEIETRHLLRLQVQKVIDWKACVWELKRRFAEKDGGVVCLRADKHQGIDLFVTIIQCVFLSVAETHSSISVLRFAPPFEHHTTDDVLRDLEKQLGFEESADWDDLHAKIKEKDGFHMVVLQYLDESEPDLRHAIEKMVATCQAGNKHLLFLVNASQKDLSETVYELPERFDETHFYDYFKETGNNDASALSKADTMMKMVKAGMPAAGCIEIAKSLDLGKL